MTPVLTSEQQELRDSVRAFLAEHAPITSVRKRFDAPDYSDQSLWIKLMELGVLSYFGEQEASVRELGLLSAEAGYGLLSENLIDSALVARLLAVELSGAEKAALSGRFGPNFLDNVAAGTLRVALAASGPAFIAIEPPKADSFSGELRFVPASAAPAALLVVSPDDGAVFLCDARGAAVSSTLEDSLDRAQFRYRFALKNSPAVRLSSLNAERIGLLVSALRAAELAGLARRALELTVEHVKTREQFDVPVGGFQAVQHAAADMMVKVEAASALADFACWACDSSPDQMKLAALSAAVFCCDEAPKVIEKAIQLHGGIGFTWEHDLHLLLRRARTLAALTAPQSAGLSQLLSAAGNS